MGIRAAQTLGLRAANLIDSAVSCSHLSLMIDDDDDAITGRIVVCPNQNIYPRDTQLLCQMKTLLPFSGAWLQTALACRWDPTILDGKRTHSLLLSISKTKYVCV